MCFDLACSDEPNYLCTVDLVWLESPATIVYFINQSALAVQCTLLCLYSRCVDISTHLARRFYYIRWSPSFWFAVFVYLASLRPVSLATLLSHHVHCVSAHPVHSTSRLVCLWLCVWPFHHLSVGRSDLIYLWREKDRKNTLFDCKHSKTGKPSRHHPQPLWVQKSKFLLCTKALGSQAIVANWWFSLRFWHTLSLLQCLHISYAIGITITTTLKAVVRPFFSSNQFLHRPSKNAQHNANIYNDWVRFWPGFRRVNKWVTFLYALFLNTLFNI